MTIFTSRSAESYDPEPYMSGYPLTGENFRHATSGPGRRYDPRPELEPTRDDLPWYCTAGGHRCDSRIREATSGQGYATHPRTHEWEWAPRDRNRNRLLVFFREAEGGWECDEIRLRLHGDSPWFEDMIPHLTPAEVEHARRVLTLLAKLTEESP